MQRSFFTLFLSCMWCFTALYSQGGKVQLFISPEQAWIRINGEVLKPNPERKMPILHNVNAGPCVIEIWYEGLALHKETVQVAANEVVVYRKGIQQIDDEYQSEAKKERKAQQSYQVNAATFGCGLGITGFTVYQTFVNSHGVNEKKRLLNRLQNDYNTTVSHVNIDQLRIDYAKANDEYVAAQKSRNGVRAVGIPVFIGAGIGSYFLYKMMKKSKAGLYKSKSANPFVYRPMLQIDAQTNMQIGFTTTF